MMKHFKYLHPTMMTLFDYVIYFLARTEQSRKQPKHGMHLCSLPHFSCW